MIVLKCYCCKNQAIVSEGCAGYCNKCHLQLQYDPRLTNDLCGKENDKERTRSERIANKPIKKLKIKKSKIKHKKHKKKKQ